MNPVLASPSAERQCQTSAQLGWLGSQTPIAAGPVIAGSHTLHEGGSGREKHCGCGEALASAAAGWSATTHSACPALLR